MRRLVIIIVVIIVVVAIALGVWWFFFSGGGQLAPSSPSGTTGTLPQTGTQGNGTGTQGTNGVGGTSGFPTGNATGTAGATGNAAAVKSFGVAFAGPVFDYFVDPQNNIIVVGPDGTITKVTGGVSSTLNSSPIENLVSAVFSYDGKKVLVSFGDPTDPQSSIFDVAAKAWTPLPQGIISPQWSPSDYRIAYLINGTTTSLFTLDTVNPKKAAAPLLTLYAQDLTLSWITKTQMVLAGKPNTFAPNDILLFDTARGTLTPIAYEQNGAESIWTGPSSSTPTLGLVFGKSGGGYSLRLEGVNGAVSEIMTFLTLPSKCVFDIERDAAATSSAAVSSTATGSSTASAAGAKAASTTAPTYPALYCGIPRDASGFSSARLPDNYDQMALFTSDDFYRVNAATGATTPLLADPSQNFDIFRPKAFNGSLFFIDRYTRALYGLSLTPAQ